MFTQNSLEINIKFYDLPMKLLRHIIHISSNCNFKAALYTNMFMTIMSQAAHCKTINK